MKKDYRWLWSDEEDKVQFPSLTVNPERGSVLDSSDGSYVFTRASRYVTWYEEDERLQPLEEQFVETLWSQKSYVSIEDVWKGRVLRDSDDFFVALIKDAKEQHSDRIVKVWKQKIDHSLWHDIAEGASFEWTFGKKYQPEEEYFQKMVFHPRLNLDTNDLDRMVDEIIQGFEDIFNDPEEDAAT